MNKYRISFICHGLLEQTLAEADAKDNFMNFVFSLDLQAIYTKIFKF